MQNNDGYRSAIEHAEASHLLVTEVLGELKNIMHRQQKLYTIIISSLMVVIVFIVSGFLWYLNQYDFTGEALYEYDVDGFYAIVDSDNNVIAQDITPEMWDNYLEWSKTNGEG